MDDDIAGQHGLSVLESEDKTVWQKETLNLGRCRLPAAAADYALGQDQRVTGRCHADITEAIGLALDRGSI